MKTGFFLLFAIVLCFATFAYSQGFTNNRSITVTGDATIYVVPDEVTIRMGVETRNIKLPVASKQNETGMANAMKFIRTFGVEEKHIQSDYVFITPEYNYNDGERILVDYIVRKNLVVTLKDLSKFNALMSGILLNGINVIHDVSFRTSKLREHRDKARDMAVRAAKEKAEAMAQALDADIASATSISEQNNRWWNWYNSGWGNRWDRAMSQNVIQNAGNSPPISESVAPGQIAVDASVSVTFALE